MPSRRTILTLSLAAAALAACRKSPDKPAAKPDVRGKQDWTLKDVVAGDWRPAAYANFLKPIATRHPTDENVAGADELFLALLPR